MKYNLWKSVYSGEIYEMPIDWLPKFGGWELIGTIEKQSLSKKIKKVLDKLPGLCYNKDS